MTAEQKEDRRAAVARACLSAVALNVHGSNSRSRGAERGAERSGARSGAAGGTRGRLSVRGALRIQDRGSPRPRHAHPTGGGRSRFKGETASRHKEVVV